MCEILRPLNVVKGPKTAAEGRPPAGQELGRPSPPPVPLTLLFSPPLCVRQFRPVSISSSTPKAMATTIHVMSDASMPTPPPAADAAPVHVPVPVPAADAAVEGSSAHVKDVRVAMVRRSVC